MIYYKSRPSRPGPASGEPRDRGRNTAAGRYTGSPRRSSSGEAASPHPPSWAGRRGRARRGSRPWAAPLLVVACAAGGSRWGSGSASARCWSSAGALVASLAFVSFGGATACARADGVWMTAGAASPGPRRSGSLAARCRRRLHAERQRCEISCCLSRAATGPSSSAQSPGRHRSRQGLRGGDVIMPASISTHASLARF